MALASIALPAAAAVRVEIEAGRSYMDSYAANTAFVEGVFDEHSIGDSRFSWSPDVSLGWINGRDIAHFDAYRYNTRDQVWLLAAGARFHYGDAGDWYHPLFLSFQPALHSGRTQALSSSYEFVSTLAGRAGVSCWASGIFPTATCTAPIVVKPWPWWDWRSIRSAPSVRPQMRPACKTGVPWPPVFVMSRPPHRTRSSSPGPLNARRAPRRLSR
ncbi:hypothetical protein [Rhodanobacter umsongensis]